MALLERDSPARAVALAARHLFGRAPICHTRLDNASVSAEHAAIWWAGDRWWVKDLGSRNGTSLDGQRLEPGVRTPIATGAVLRFGRDQTDWRLVDDGPPKPAARSGEAHVVADQDLLALPSADDPEVVVYPRYDGWWLEGTELEETVEDQHQVVAGGRTWTLALPPIQGGGTDTTADASRALQAAVELVLYVSADQEYIELEVRMGGDRERHEHRSHHDLLRALTVARAADREAGVDPSEQGWVYVDALTRELAVSEQTLRLHIFRARKTLEKAGVPGAASLVERRSATRQLRLGPWTARIEAL